MKVFFVGGASQARICHNILKRQGHEVPVIYDQTRGLLPPWDDCKVIDDEGAIPEYAATCEGFVVCIGDTHGKARVRYSQQLKELGLKPVSAIHPTAYFSEDSKIGEGVQAMMRCFTNDYAVVGDYCILNTNCAVGHEVTIGTGVHVMGFAVVTALVTVGDFTSIGTHATILPRLTIGNNCVIGAGAVVTKDIPDNAVVAGVPARILRYQASEDSPGRFTAPSTRPRARASKRSSAKPHRQRGK